MLNRIRALFQRQTRREMLSLQELPLWLDDEERRVTKNLFSEMAEHREILEQIVQKIEEGLKHLAEGELHNKNIPLRAIQVMEGNRAAYVKRTEDFLQHVSLEWTDLAEVQEFIAMILRELDSLNQGNTRSYLILKEFFADDVIKIGAEIKRFELEVKGMQRTIAESSLAQARSMRKLLKSIEAAEGHRHRVADDINGLKAELVQELNHRAATARQLKHLQEGSEFQEWKELVHEREDIIGRMKQLEDELFQLFSVLEAGLKKSAHRGQWERLVIDYVTNPALALVEDKERHILKILSGLKEQLASGKLELKDAKRERTMKVLHMITPEYLSQCSTMYDELRHARRMRDEKMRRSVAIQNYNELEYRLQHADQKILGVESAIEEQAQVLEKITADAILKELREEMLRLNKELTS